MPRNLLLTGAFPYTQKELENIEKLGFSIDFKQHESDFIEHPEKYVCTVCNGLFLYHDITKFTQLKMIQLTSAGMDRAPVDYAAQHEIRIFNARDVYHIPMAEWAVLKVLEIYKHSRFFYDMQARHIWKKHRGLQELTDKKVCIVGIGSVGKETAKRFKCFGAEIVGVDIEYKQDKYVDEFFDISQIDAAIMKSDVVILTLPHTPQTHHLVGDKLLKVFKQDAILVNLSRGGIIDESALAERIREGTFLGVALDVFEEEPLNSNNPLWNFENVIITPHNSFVSNKTRERLFTLICHNLESFCREL